MVSGGVRVKPIMKKVALVNGVLLDMEDIQNYLDGMECCMDNGEFYLNTSDKMTVKVKGKVVDNKDVTISFEEV